MDWHEVLARIQSASGNGVARDRVEAGSNYPGENRQAKDDRFGSPRAAAVTATDRVPASTDRRCRHATRQILHVAG